MSISHIVRNRLTWALAAGVVVFLVLVLLFAGLSWAQFGKVFVFALVGAVVAIAIPLFTARETVAISSGTSSRVLSRVASGDLSLSSAEIDRSSGNKQMASAVRGLVLNLERTISRFGQLSTDVSNVSEQINEKAQNLSRISVVQIDSAATTTSSVTEIDQSINSVQKSMENLSLNAEETSTSVLEMSASIEEVSRIADRLSEFVEQAASAIDEMIASINEVALNTESFSSFALETSSSMVEMNATTVEIGKSARQSSEFAVSVREATIEGQEAVKSSVDGMENISQTVSTSKVSLQSLVERSLEIGEIVRVIDEIAGQTNLLALNAAIIAAQAGERGKGFAVVADEIRDLSERTSASTDEIRTLIENVQRGVEQAMDQMSSTADRVSEGVSLTARAARVLEKILDLTERSTASIAEIARATEEQIRGSQAATQAIEEVTKMVQQTASATQEQSETSKKIGDQVSTVRDYTNHLRRAMEEQESGSRSISQAMENIMHAVGSVVSSTSVLSRGSGSIVTAMKAIEQGTRESSLAAADLSQMGNTLRHESSLLTQQLGKFILASEQRGGSIVTATVLPHRFTLDPAKCGFMALGYMGRAVHETLLSFGEGAELVAGIADRWEVLEHGTLYRLHIRDGATFHSGRPVTARDVVGTFNRLLWPETETQGRWIMLDVVGAEDVVSGRTRSAEGLIAVSEKVVEIRLEKPLAFFLSMLSMSEAAIVPIDDVKDPSFELQGAGAGAFRIENVVAGQSLKLSANRNYFDAGRPFVDSLEFRLDLKSTKEVYEAFLRDELDIAHGLPPTLVDELKRDPLMAPYVIDNVQLHTSYLAYDTTHPPFDDVNVRRALNHAIDKERINREVFSGLGVVANSLLPPGLLGYDPGLHGIEYDPERARSLMQKAGYGSGFTVEYLRFDTDEFYNQGTVPRIIEDLAKIGIRVEEKQSTAEKARAAREKKGHSYIGAGNWYADFPDSDNFFYIFFHSESSTWLGMHYSNPTLDKMIDEARRTSDVDRRRELYQALNKIVVDEAPMACLFHDRFFAVHKPHVRGLRTYLVPPPVRYHNVWIER
jgi:methyl-accepting chemotaxis protein/ABC-type oligopeptide transport system substrate-binding subunit